MRRITSILILLMLTACAPLGIGTSDSGNTVTLGGNTPKAITEAFFNAWNAGSMDEMYRNISVRSQQLYTPEAFTRYYQSVQEEVGVEGVSLTIHDVETQGTSALVNYDLTMQSTLFGEINDTNRKLRLVKDGEQWRVAWSTMDIFEGYTGDAILTVETEPTARENIYDRNGNPLVIENGTVSVLYARQEAMSDVFDCQLLLANLLYMSVFKLQERFQNYLPDARFYVGEIDESVELENAARLRDVCGMTRENADIYTRQTRQYIGQGAAIHATGYVGQVPQEDRAQWIARGYSETDLVGLTGIENAYQAQLAGQPPRVLRVIEPGGTVLKELGRSEGSPPQPVYLTLDRDLQIETMRTLAWGYNYARNNWARPDISPGAGAVVMDVNTGAILAMASYPTFQPVLFDPNNPYIQNRGQLLADVQNDPRQPFKNRVTQESYFPASTFKIVSTAAAINEGLFEPDERFYCGLTWDGTEYGDTFSPRLDWRFTDGLEATGDIVPSQGLTSSCDPFFYEVGARLFRETGQNTLVRYARELGLGGQPGIGIYPEASSDLPVPPSVEDAINNAIGQGNTQITILHGAKMTTAVANGGTVYQPYIVAQVGNQRVGEPVIENTVDYPPEVLATVQRGMCDVMTDPDKGTAYWIFSDNPGGNAQYTACGKTGTAQAGAYPHAWFVAYAPAENPEIAVVVMAQNSREGSDVAAPMVRRIIDAYFGTPIAPFPEWWEGEYVPLEVPENGVAGG